MPARNETEMVGIEPARATPDTARLRLALAASDAKFAALLAGASAVMSTDTPDARNIR